MCFFVPQRRAICY